MRVHSITETDSFTYIAMVTTLTKNGINNISYSTVHFCFNFEGYFRVAKVKLIDFHDLPAGDTTPLPTSPDDSRGDSIRRTIESRMLQCSS